MLTQFESKENHCQYSTYGNELDFLIYFEDTKMIVDAKYKLRYKNGQVHQGNQASFWLRPIKKGV